MTMLLLLISPALAATLTVGASGSYSQIQDAIDAASDGDTIEIESGRYVGCVDLGGRDLTLQGAGSAITAVEGDGSCGTALAMEDGETASVLGLSVVNTSGRGIALVDANVSFEDVAVTGSGAASLSEGGGVYVSGGAASFVDCTLDGNTADHGGDLFGTGGATLTLTDTRVSSGTASQGGGIYLDSDSTTSATLLLEDTQILTNEAAGQGGGVYLGEAAVLESRGNAYEGNTGIETNGAALYVATGGSVSSADDQFIGNQSDPDESTDSLGGAIFLLGDDTLDLDGSSFSANAAIYGGAIFAMDSNTLRLTDTAFDSNKADVSGGAIFMRAGGDLEIVGGSFDGNEARHYDKAGGGAIFLNDSITASVSGTTFTDNVGNYGGAIYAMDGGTLEMDDVDLDGNSAHNGGGALYLNYLRSVVGLSEVSMTDNTAGWGGAICVYVTTDLDIQDSTFSDNTAEAGGALHVSEYSDIAISTSTFDGNTASLTTGGAIFHEGYDTEKLAISDSNFTDNTAAKGGGAMYGYGSGKVQLSGCHFDGNGDPAADGGALLLKAQGKMTISDSRFCQNVGDSGGAVYMDEGTYGEGACTWSNNLFVENDASTSGGALFLREDPLSLGGIGFQNNDFVGNSAAESGGSVFLTAAVATFDNNIVAFTQDGDGVYVESGTLDSKYTYNDWYANTLLDVGGAGSAPSSSLGNIATDPGFVDYTRDGDCDNDDLTLVAGSALVDAGDPAVRDIDGSISDIGAYGGPGSTVYDGDGDGSLNTVDCDDTDPMTYPGAAELCDGIDNDCDGVVDEDPVATWYADADGDGYGDPLDREATGSCAPPAGYADNGSDCDDTDPDRSPAASEICDGVDDDCDSLIDESDAVDAISWYADADGDGYGDPSESTLACTAPAGFVADPSDCDDTDSAIFPGAVEIPGDAIDQDCDGGELCYIDADADGYRPDGTSTVVSDDTDCSDPGEALASEPDGDCDDTDPSVHPGGLERPGDGIDGDCDGTEYCYIDADGDGYRTGLEIVELSADLDCTDPGEAAATVPTGDCDDTDPAYHPDADESDCTDPNDYNCDGSVAYADADGDGLAACADCDDANAAVGDPTTWYPDADGDGYTDAAGAVTSCKQPDGSSAIATADDCDDGDASRYPGAEEIPDDGIDQDCDGSDLTTDTKPVGHGCAVSGDGEEGWALLLGALALARRRRLAAFAKPR